MLNYINLTINEYRNLHWLDRGFYINAWNKHVKILNRRNNPRKKIKWRK